MNLLYSCWAFGLNQWNMKWHGTDVWLEAANDNSDAHGINDSRW